MEKNKDTGHTKLVELMQEIMSDFERRHLILEIISQASRLSEEKLDILIAAIKSLREKEKAVTV